MRGLEVFIKATRYQFILLGRKKKNPYLQIFKQGMGMICPKELFWENRKEKQHEENLKVLRIAWSLTEDCQQLDSHTRESRNRKFCDLKAKREGFSIFHFCQVVCHIPENSALWPKNRCWIHPWSSSFLAGTKEDGTDRAAFFVWSDCTKLNLQM